MLLCNVLEPFILLNGNYFHHVYITFNYPTDLYCTFACNKKNKKKLKFLHVNVIELVFYLHILLCISIM